ncbi:hypothetical protein KQX54_008273 [Cotesia glomerata]|uniref:Uncharacterized protein n=1 Tax=Cotesia glomerata TaxID=32391 RepID=A0AAV7HQD1_COTGL|nr:hypothetical protein KQX54_008273 [Cotesia glomerata]
MESRLVFCMVTNSARQREKKGCTLHQQGLRANLRYEDDLYAAYSREWKRFEIPRRVNDLGTLMEGKGNDDNSGEKRIVQ